MTWQQLSDGIYHYCGQRRPRLDERIEYVPACELKDVRVAEGSGDSWCRRCIGIEARTIGRGRR